MDGDRLEITVEARLLWFLGLRECDDPSDSVSRRNFHPSPWIPQFQATDGDMSKESVERKAKPGRRFGQGFNYSIIFFFSLDSDSDSDLYLDLDLDL